MFICEYCETKFLTENNFNSHKCETKKRILELETVKGINAFNYYLAWFRKRKLHPQQKNTFITSKYYNSFIKFVEFINEKGIPDSDLYIQVMCSENILPIHWCNDDIYDYFIDYFDNNFSASTHLKITLLTMEKLSEIFECKISDIFNHLRVIDIITLLQTRNLSPLILLLSNKFKLFLSNTLNSYEQELIETFIIIPHWKKIFENNKKYIPEIKKCLNELEL